MSDNIRYYPFPGYRAPNLPAGMWAGVDAVTGNVSGGTMSVDLIFQPTSQPITGRMFSLEQIAVSSELNSAAAADLSSIALGRASNITFDSLHANMPLVAGSALARIAARDLVAIKGWFLGQQNRNSTEARLRFSTANSDGDTMTFQAEGYWWDVRSLNVEGGPQRPATGMYS